MQKFILLLIFVIPVGAYAQKGKSKIFTGVIEFEEIWNLNERGQRFIDSILQAKLDQAIRDGSIEDTALAQRELGNSDWIISFLEAMNTYHILELTIDSVFIKKTVPVDNEITQIFDAPAAESKTRQHTAGKIIRKNFADSKYRYEIHRDEKRNYLGYQCYKIVTTSLEAEDSGDDIFGMGEGYQIAEIWVTDKLNLEANLIDEDTKSYNLGFPLMYKYYYSDFPGLSVSFEVTKVIPDLRK